MDKILEHKTDWKLGETVKPDDLNRLELNDKELASQSVENAKSLADCIKKDGSVAFDDFIEYKLKCNNNKKVKLTSHSSKEEAIIYIGDEAVLGLANTFLGRGANENQSLGDPGWAWKDVWVGNCNNSGNGFNRATNGFIEQWGVISIPTGQTALDWTISFPIPFPTAMRNFTPVIFNAPDAWGGRVFTQLIDNTRIRIVALDLNSLKAGVSIRWRAIGY